MTQPNPLAPLAAYRQFILVRLVPLPGGKTNKLPLTPSGELTPKDSGGAHNPAFWMTWQEAHDAALRLGSGHTVGFVLTAADPFWCIDIDGCIQADNTYTQIVHDLAGQLGTGVVWEQSQSRKGLHLWGTGLAPDVAHGKKNTAAGLECYTSLRFIALGEPLGGDMSTPCAGIHAVVSRYFPVRHAAGGDMGDDGPVAEWVGPTDDDELIRRACRSTPGLATESIGFGGAAPVLDTRVSFADLWERNVPAMAARWQSDKGDGYDGSSADSALAMRLAFWTGRDAARVERLMRRSGLVRDKWDSMRGHQTYLQQTVLNACAMQSEVLKDKPSAVEERLAGMDMPTGVVETCKSIEDSCKSDEVIEDAVIRVVAGRTFVTRDEQMKLFEGCCYVASKHEILMRNGRMLSPNTFNVMMGGFTFMLGGAKSRTTTKAWEAFTENQDLDMPKADDVCFKPALPFGKIVVSEGLRRVNKFLPPNVRMVEGDPTPLREHLKKLLPVGDDALILESYMAACVQHAGHKFPWAPVIQGVEGNGKTMLSIVTSYAVGKKYTHWPAAGKIAAQFNKWMEDKLLYCVEDIYTPGLQGEVVMERLKPMVTGGRGLEIEGKGADQHTGEVCGNFLVTTNHKDGIRKSARDRRYCMLYCAQQDDGDLERDFGPDVNAYMNRMYHWLDHEDGLAISAHWLKNMPIPPKYDPTRGAQRAPKSSAHDEAVAAGLGMVEQMVLEAIDEGRIGFRGGFVSGNMLKTLLGESGKDRFMTPNKRKEVMHNIGYVPHPNLPRGGRVVNSVLPDAGYPILYVKPGTPQHALTVYGEIAKAYTQGQTSR